MSLYSTDLRNTKGKTGTSNIQNNLKEIGATSNLKIITICLRYLGGSTSSSTVGIYPDYSSRLNTDAFTLLSSFPYEIKKAYLSLGYGLTSSNGNPVHCKPSLIIGAEHIYGEDKMVAATGAPEEYYENIELPVESIINSKVTISLMCSTEGNGAAYIGYLGRCNLVLEVE